MKRYHLLKTIQPFFNDVSEEIKTFEVRKNDRDFKVGDVLRLQEYNQDRNTFTGRELRVNVTYILDDQRYCKDGYIVMGIEVYGRNF